MFNRPCMNLFCASLPECLAVLRDATTRQLLAIHALLSSGFGFVAASQPRGFCARSLAMGKRSPGTGRTQRLRVGGAQI